MSHYAGNYLMIAAFIISIFTIVACVLWVIESVMDRHDLLH